MLDYVYRVTKYDPADRDAYGHYVGTQDESSDHGPVEAAYLRAVAAFAEDTGMRHLTIREPYLASGFTHFGTEPIIEGYGLAGLFPPGSFHDGADIPVLVGLELVRAMLRGSGAWCRLEVDGRFAVHVGWDQYLYVGSSEPCERALDLTRDLGLFAERLDASPYDPDYDEPGEQRPADDDFWNDLDLSMTGDKALLLEEGYVQNAARWHRLTRENRDAVRAGLAPRAMLTVWPDLSPDIEAVLSALPAEYTAQIVWEDSAGRISDFVAESPRTST